MAAYYKVEVSLNTNSITVGAPSAQEVLVTLPLVGPAGAVGATGATGATGPAGSGIEILTTQGDLLYRGAAAGERLPIGTSGQVLKVAGGIPVWGAESGAVSSVAGRTGAVTLAVADVANAVSTSDARLSDARTPSSTLAHAASHHTGGTDEIAARSIGGLAVATRTEVTYSASLTLPAARHTELVVNNTNAAGITLNLPPAADGTLVGDTYSIVGGPTVSGTITIVSIGTFFTFTLATITATGQRSTARAGASTGQGSWELVTVDKHTHVAADITGLPEASTTTPAALGTAAVGVGTTFARADHVHAMPTAANVGAAQAVTDIELTPDGTTTITTAQLPARGIAFSEDEATFTVNLPTPGIRQSGLTFSIKSEYEAGSGPNFITVVHSAVNLLTAVELDEAEGSIDFLWDGYRWVYDAYYALRSYPNRVLLLPASSGTLALTQSADDVFRVVGSADATKKVAFEVDGLSTATTRTLTVPNSSGTIALNETFAAPPSIGNTTPNSGFFTTLNATGTTELINGTSAAGPFLMYRSFTNASNYERGFMRWDSGILRIGTERLGGSGNIDFELTRMGSAWVRLINSGLNIDTALRVNLGQPVFVNGGFIQLAASNGASSVILDRDGAGIFAQRNATDAQEYRLYGTYTSATNYQRITVKSVKQTLSALSGASATTTGTFIPGGAVVVGVTTRVSTLLAGATGYTIGDGTDADRWGDITGTAVGTTSDNRNWTAGSIECFTAGGNITLTAKISNFTAGAIEVCVFYLAGEAD